MTPGAREVDRTDRECNIRATSAAVLHESARDDESQVMELQMVMNYLDWKPCNKCINCGEMLSAEKKC